MNFSLRYYAREHLTIYLADICQCVNDKKTSMKRRESCTSKKNEYTSDNHETKPHEIFSIGSICIIILLSLSLGVKSSLAHC